jgi:hypothetical protein
MEGPFRIRIGSFISVVYLLLLFAARAVIEIMSGIKIQRGSKRP